MKEITEACASVRLLLATAVLACVACYTDDIISSLIGSLQLLHNRFRNEWLVNVLLFISNSASKAIFFMKESISIDTHPLFLAPQWHSSDFGFSIMAR